MDDITSVPKDTRHMTLELHRNGLINTSELLRLLKYNLMTRKNLNIYDHI